MGGTEKKSQEEIVARGKVAQGSVCSLSVGSRGSPEGVRS